MAKIKTKKKITHYSIELSQHEMEILYTVLADTVTESVYAKMEQHGFKVDESDDFVYALYNTVNKVVHPDEY